uniref:Conserved oligomeric Golgi complex subunit 3 n=1 Tax=Gongylonema pulchrum TaxID=637853 RepID=A0A183D671_9BILA
LQKLNSGKFTITGQVFTQILSTIDECLRFLRSHIHYKDSAAYITKYEQCLSKYSFTSTEMLIQMTIHLPCYT